MSPESDGAPCAGPSDPPDRRNSTDAIGAPAHPRPLLMVDIDGVISLFGAPALAAGDSRQLEGSFHSIEGIPHFISSAAAAHLLALTPYFDLVWASGWEEKANEHLPRLLGLPEPLPFLSFARPADAARGAGDAGAASEGPGVGGLQITRGHWKLESIDTYAGGRPLAWIDDALSLACHEWAAARRAPTLLVQTVPEQGLTSREAQLLEDWARALQAP